MVDEEKSVGENNINERKKWNAPRMNVVSIGDLTDGLAGPNVELNTTTRS